MQTVLVTGGAGFLGSHLCKKLLDFGNKVVCLDNFYTGRIENIKALINHPNFVLLEHDVIRPVDVKVDAIYNLACPASPIQYQKDPIYTTQISVMGALNVLNLAKELQCPILQASTSEVYGDPLVHPQPESYWGHVNCHGIRSCYDEGKRCAESLFFDYHRQHQVDIRVARIFNTYGPHMDPKDGRVVSNFIVQALQGVPLTLYGDGSQTRSFCYVDDLIDGFIQLMKTPNIHQPINLGNSNEYRMTELAERVIKLTGSASKVTYKPLPQDDPTQRCPDLTLAKQTLNWTPKTDLLHGLQSTIQYFKESLQHSTTSAIL